jgi:hypothetical protein
MLIIGYKCKIQKLCLTPKEEANFFFHINLSIISSRFVVKSWN